MSTDEKTGIQALEQAPPSLSMQPGQVECRELEYIRHGTQCLITYFNQTMAKPFKWTYTGRPLTV